MNIIKLASIMLTCLSRKKRMHQFSQIREKLENINTEELWNKIIECKTGKEDNRDETIKYIKTNCPFILKIAGEAIRNSDNFKTTRPYTINKSKRQKIIKEEIDSIPKVVKELKKIEALDLFDTSFNKQRTGVHIIQKEVIRITNEAMENNQLPHISDLEKYRNKLILIRLIYRIKKFLADFSDEISIDEKAELIKEYKVLELIDDLLWKIPEMKYKKKEQRFQCIKDGYKETDKNKIEMDHVIDREAIKRFLLTDLSCGKHENIDQKIDKLTPYLIGCSIPRKAHNKIAHESDIKILLENPFRMYLNDKNETNIKDIKKWKNLIPQMGDHGVWDKEEELYLHEKEHPYNPYAPKDSDDYKKHTKFIESILETHSIELFNTETKYTWAMDRKKWET